MSKPTLTRLYDSLTSKLGKETAEDLTNYIDNKITTTVDNKSQVLADKEDLSKLEIRLTNNFNARFDRMDTRIDKMDTRIDKLDARIDHLEAKFDTRIDKLEARFDHLEAKFDTRFEKLDAKFDGKYNELKNEITSSHNNLMRWMFIFWVGQLVAIFGFLLLFLGK
jgi:chromosome segregation ATPase